MLRQRLTEAAPLDDVRKLNVTSGDRKTDIFRRLTQSRSTHFQSNPIFMVQLWRLWRLSLTSTSELYEFQTQRPAVWLHNRRVKSCRSNTMGWDIFGSARIFSKSWITGSWLLLYRINYAILSDIDVRVGSLRGTRHLTSPLRQVRFAWEIQTLIAFGPWLQLHRVGLQYLETGNLSTCQHCDWAKNKTIVWCLTRTHQFRPHPKMREP